MEVTERKKTKKIFNECNYLNTNSW